MYFCMFIDQNDNQIHNSNILFPILTFATMASEQQILNMDTTHIGEG